MYEYQGRNNGLGLIHDDDVNVFEGGIGMNSPARPRRYPGITAANVNVFGSGISVLPAPAPSPVVGIESCATGNCRPSGLGTIDAANGRPWWHYAALGAGVGLGYMYLRRARMVRNPEDLTKDELQELLDKNPGERVKQAAAITIQAGIPTILWGPPGIGKTQWVYGLGETMKFMNNGEPVKVITVIGSTKDPTDISGMPRLKGGYYPPSWAQELHDRAMDGKRSILFLDEFSSMSAIVHAALLRVVNEKVAGDLDFDPKGGPLKGHAVHIVMAANRKKHGAGAMDLPPPAANRIIHFEWPKMGAFEWADGMLFGWSSPFYFKLPADWRKSPLVKKAKSEIASFLIFKQKIMRTPVLFDMPTPKNVDTEHGGKATGGAWPSPRSWDLAAQALGAGMVAGAPKNVNHESIKGAVGTAAATELFSFRRFEDIEDPEKILRAPTSWDVPKDESLLFLSLNSILNAVIQKPTEKRYKAAFRAIAHAHSVTGEGAIVAMPASQLMQVGRDTGLLKKIEISTDPDATAMFDELTELVEALGWRHRGRGARRGRAR